MSNLKVKEVEEIIQEFREKFKYWSGIKVFCAMELSEKEVKVLEMREQKKTLEEVGKAFGVTRERIRQIEAKANEKVRMKDYFEDWLRIRLTKLVVHGK